MFADADEYEVMHVQGRAALGLPRTGRRGEKLAPSKQKTTDVALHLTNHLDLDDPSVVVHIQSRFWPANLIKDLTFLTRDEVADYFPSNADISI